MFSYTGMILLISLLSSDMNISPDPATVNLNKILLNTFPFCNCNELTMPSVYNSCDYNKEHDDCKYHALKKMLLYFAFKYQ